MKIDINKKYRYRMGDPVRILCVDAVGHKCGGKPQPVVALDSKTGEVTFHFEDGKFDSCRDNDALDLIEVEAREPREWDVHLNQQGNVHDCREPDGVKYALFEKIRVREIID